MARKKSADDTTENRKVGRPSRFTPEWAERVCSKIAEGMAVYQVGKLEGFPAEATIYRWLAAEDVGQKEGEVGPHAAFREAYARACELRATPRFEKLRKIADDVARGAIDPQAARAAADIEKWCLGREMPKKYGDAMTLRGDKDNPLQIRKAPELSDEELAALAAGGLREAT